MKLIIEDDEGRKTVVPIVREEMEITIGRQEGNTIRLTERNVSRKHAKLTRKGGSVFVEDVGSYNGIKVNGDKIQGRFQVREGDLIQIGDYDLAVQYEGVKPDPAPEAPRDRNDTIEMQNGHAPQGDDELPAGTDTVRTSAQAIANAAAAASSSLNGGSVKKHESTSVINPAQLKGLKRKVEDISADEAPRLVCLTGDNAGREWACIRTEIKLGRTDDNDIAIDHRSLSRNHCKVIRDDDGQWKVLDLESANGVKVNGEPYAQSALRSGDVVELGHLKFKFVVAGDDFTYSPEMAAKAEAAGLAPGTLPPETGSLKKKAPLIAAAVVGVLVLGTAGYFATRPTPVTTTIDKPVPDPTPLKKDPEPLKKDPEIKAADPVPDEPTFDPKGMKALEAGKDLLAKGKFADAEKKLVLAKESGIKAAEGPLAQARAEQEAIKHLAEAQKRFGNKDLQGAKTELEAIPPDSTSAAKAKSLFEQVAAAEARTVKDRDALDARAKAEEERKAKAEEAKAKADEAKAKADEARAKAEEERKAKADEAKAKADEDRKAKAEAAKKAEEDKKAKASAKVEKPDESQNESMTTGRDLYKKKKYKEAATYFEKALVEDSTLAEAHLYLGSCYASINDLKRGAHHYDLFVRMRPDHKQAPGIREILRKYYEQYGPPDGK